MTRRRSDLNASSETPREPVVEHQGKVGRVRKVLDANCFQSPTPGRGRPVLEEYFQASKQNTVVFTELACMEAYKGNALVNVRKSMEVASRYPTQVLVLKATVDIIQQQARDPSSTADDFVDVEQTNGFAEFCEVLRLASEGNPHCVRQVRAHGDAAAVEFARMLEAAKQVRVGIAEHEASMNPALLRSLRRNEPIPPALVDEAGRAILEYAASYFQDRDDGVLIPRELKVARETLLFRHALSSFNLAEWWISKGGYASVAPEKLLNDIVDLTYVTYATFFDGLISNDQKMLQIYEATRFLVDEVFI
jgi:hypothetical protein